MEWNTYGKDQKIVLTNATLPFPMLLKHFRPVEGLGPTLHKQGGNMELHKQEEKVTHIKQLQQSIQEYAKLSPTTEALGS